MKCSPCLVYSTQTWLNLCCLMLLFIDVLLVFCFSSLDKIEQDTSVVQTSVWFDFLDLRWCPEEWDRVRRVGLPEF